MKLREKIKRFWTLDVHNHQGFTLVELIIVIAILAILSSVAVAGYSSYIKKANKAADEALLYEINQAFRSACIENMCDVFDISAAEWDMDNMTVASVEDNATHPIIASFEEFFDVANPKFKVIEEIFFNKKTHMWEENVIGTFYFNGQEIKLSASDIAKLSGDNAFSSMGAAALLGEVGTLEKLIGIGAGEDILGAIGSSEAFITAFAGYLGLKMEDYESEDDYWLAYEEKLAELEETNPNATTNAMVMYAASSAANASDEQISSLFTYVEGGALTGRIEGATEAETMTNAALAYGMYIAYAQQNGIDTTDVANFSKTVNTKEFAAYCASEEGQADLEAYLAAMSMIGDNTSDSEITGSILEDGISDNADLEELMKEIMGN